MKRRLLILVLGLLPVLFLHAQEQKVKRSEIIETLRGVRYYIHFVGQGETLGNIAAAYETTPGEIIRQNPEISQGLKANQVLKIEVGKSLEKEPDPETQGRTRQDIPTQVLSETPSGKVHVIEPKETWYGISRLYQVSVKALLAANPGKDTLKIGMKINIPERIVLSEKTQVQQPGGLQHTIAAQETLYSISKKYKVTVDALYQANPGLTENIQAGQVLNIPVVVQQASQGIETDRQPNEKPEPPTQRTDYTLPDNYIEYTVQKKETLYAIARSHGVEVAGLMEANPGLTGDLKKGQVIRIPVKVNKPVTPPEPQKPAAETEQTDEPAKTPDPCMPGSAGDRTWQVALLIPFQLEQADSIGLGDAGSLRVPSDYRSLDFIQFYEGALLAIDSLSRTGLKVKVNVFDADAGEHTSKTRRLLAKPEMKEMDLIIGPFFAKSFELVSAFAASHSIPLVNPLSQRAEIIADNPYVFKVQPSPWVQYNELARYLANGFPDANVLIMTRNAEENAGVAASFKTSLSRYNQGSITVKESVYSQSADAGVLNKLVSGRQNVVVLLTSDKALLPALLRKLNDARSTYNITVVGLPDWESLELDSHYLLNLNTHLFNPWFVDYSSPAVKNFVRKFNERFLAEPELDKYAFLGYDISFYFLNNLFHYGRGFSRCLSNIEHQGLSTCFTFRKTENGGFENAASSVYGLVDYKRRLLNR